MLIGLDMACTVARAWTAGTGWHGQFALVHSRLASGYSSH